MANSVQKLGLGQLYEFVPVHGGIALDNDFLIMDVSYTDTHPFREFPYRSNAYFVLFCKSGHLSIEVNLKTYDVTEKSLLISTPGNMIRINDTQNAEDSSFIVLAISKEFISEINYDFDKIFDERHNLISNPCVKFSDELISCCSKYIELFETLNDMELDNKKDVVGAVLASLFHVFCDYIEKSRESMVSPDNHGSPSSNRNTLLFNHFMSLVNEHHATYRNMAFYAKKLELTPKYLSKLIKLESGRSGPDWIDAFVILEAKNLLKYTDLSIKEIVFRLNFPNPSVFYKYFKSHTGMTPSEYRNQKPV